MPSYEVTCAGCGTQFTAKSPRAKWHSPGCKKQAQRNPPPTEAVEPGSPEEHPIVAAVRKELVHAGKVETVDGQVALLLAGQAVAAGAANVGTLIRQMREVLDAALGRKPGGEPAPEPEVADPAPSPADELTKARKSREHKLAQARQAAGRA